MIKENPYFSAKFFHLLATKATYDDAMPFDDFEDVATNASVRDSETLETMSQYSSLADSDQLSDLQPGEILPEKVRSLVFNMSRYFYRSLFSMDMLKKYEPNYNLLRVMKVWL